MPIKSFNPRSPGIRSKTVLVFDEITKVGPEKSLLFSKNKSGGRNSYGRITAKYIGGGHKRLGRIVDFKRNKDGIPGKVASVEYDPNRSANIALINYLDGEKRYIIAPVGLKVGEEIISGDRAEVKLGNSLMLKYIPVGSTIHNIELSRGKGGQIARSAGMSAQLLAKEDKWAHVRLPSNEVRLIEVECRATVGQVGNIDFEKVSIGKAGRNRWLGKRPRTRAVAMNPVDHPMGGGEGKTSGGRHPCSFNVIPSKGYKTRSKRKKSDKLIVKRRK